MYSRLSGLPGRPRFEFDVNWLSEAVSSTRRIPLQTLAKSLGIHRNTLRYHLHINGCSNRQFSNITDQELDEVIHHYKLERPSAGRRFVMAYLTSHGISVQRKRVEMSIQRVSPLRQILCSKTMIQRRVYYVPRSNYLWHLDGHHKLIRWGFVIHGIIDGYCRTVCNFFNLKILLKLREQVVALRASTNNYASTVLGHFLGALDIYGTPSHVRGDRGGENMDVAVWMIQHRGPNRSSFMWGKSTSNSRIERLWVDTGIQFVRHWRAFFARLEDIHLLDAHDPCHLWLLQLLFLDELNHDCHQFQQDWNHHPISKHGHNQTPLVCCMPVTYSIDSELLTFLKDMRFLSELQHGIYPEPSANIHPDILTHYEGSEVDIPGEIMENQNHNVRHAAVAVPPTTMPFHSMEANEAFILALQVSRDEGIIPTGYGVAEDEWESEIYPEVEVITVGRAAKEYVVHLPFGIWWPRAVLWAQGLDALSAIGVIGEGL